MGLIKAATGAVGGGLADQWLEVIEPYEMDDNTVFTKGTLVRKKDRRNSNRKGSEDVISNGSVIHVYPNQFMILVDGGRIIDYTAEEGYYRVDTGTMPSMFSGRAGDALKESFSRFKYGGVTQGVQKVFLLTFRRSKGLSLEREHRSIILIIFIMPSFFCVPTELIP